MNYLHKEFVKSFDWSDFHQDRRMEKEEVINGRTYYKTGTCTSTTIVGDLYKVTDPSNEQINYVLLMGVARQHPCDIKINFSEGVETAAINAKVNPFATIKFNHKVEWETFRMLAEVYSAALPVQFIKTREEIAAAGLDAEKYNR